MDVLSIVGVIVGIGAIVLGMFLDGGNIASLLNFPALVIVLGGTLGATMLQSPYPLFIRAFKMLPFVIIPPKIDLSLLIAKITSWSVIARKNGLLGLEDEIEKETDTFTIKAMQLLVDGNSLESIRDILELEMNTKETRDLQAAKTFESMGGYAPTIGILGAVMGLIHVMQNLTNPESLGAGIATAFVATIYGVGSANLIFFPIFNKLKNSILQQSQAHEMLIEGVTSIALGESPRRIELKLNSYLCDTKPVVTGGNDENPSS